jgi:hypothetical protein
MQKVVLLFVVLIFVLGSVCKAFRLQASRGTHQTVNGATGSLGSDLLPRPDDEDSPEFKEYLRTLLKMQANRAKSGFAAPST